MSKGVDVLPGRNIQYETDAISKFYSAHRTKYEDFYPSERRVLEHIHIHESTSVLDIGCACGGLGLALNERFGCRNYTGIEINSQAAEMGARLVADRGGRVFQADINDAARLLVEASVTTEFDIVISFSALDWNLEVERNVCSAWNLVAPGGTLVMSARLHDGPCLLDPTISYQPTSPEDSGGSEYAPYVVMNMGRVTKFVSTMGAASALVVGQYGPPSPTAVTPATKVLFVVVALVKANSPVQQMSWAFDLPDSARALIECLVDGLGAV